MPTVNPIKIIAAAAVALVVVFVALMGNSVPSQVESKVNRVLLLYSEDLRFNSTNPTISIKAGETIKLILVNKDVVVHNFKIRGIAIRSREVVREGEQDEIILKVERLGSFTYFCSHHPVIMDGQLVVEP